MGENTVIIEQKPFDKLKQGVDEIANVVKETLGPAGKNILIDRDKAIPLSTRDGVTVAKFVNFKDRIKNFAAQLIKQAAAETNAEAGDGTTTATVLTQAIFNEGLKYVAAGHNIMHVRRSIEEAVKEIITNLDKESIKILSYDGLKGVATISANNDEMLGKIIADAIHKVGQKGTVLVEASSDNETTLKFQDGIMINRGWGDTSPYFVTNIAKRIAEYNNPSFVIIDDKIHSFEQLEPVVKWAVQNKSPIIIAVRDIEESVLGWLVANKLKAGVQVCVIHLPGYNNIDLIEDFAASVNAAIFNQDWNHISSFKPDQLGKAKRVVITQNECRIIEGSGDISKRIETLKAELAEETIQAKKNRLQDRINSLTNSVATLYVAAESDTEMQDTKLRVEDAINATRAASERGVIAGSGIVLFRQKLASETIGAKIMNVAVEAPFRNIVLNAGDNPEKVIAEIDRTGLGYDANEKKYCNLMDKGIIDPCLVTITALKKAASVAVMLLTTGSCIVYERKE